MRIWKENWLSFIRYGMLVLLVVFIVALLGADKTSEAKIEAVEKAVEKEVPLTGMHSVQSQMVKRLYGLNVNDYEGVVLYISDSNMGAEELLIVKLADTSQAEAVESAVQTRIENQENSFEGYGVEQYQLLQEHGRGRACDRAQQDADRHEHERALIGAHIRQQALERLGIKLRAFRHRPRLPSAGTHRPRGKFRTCAAAHRGSRRRQCGRHRARRYGPRSAPS